jgi:iron complex outermembrane receptor protein
MNRVKTFFVIFSTFLASEAFSKELTKAKLEPIIVTANPLGRSGNDLTQPITVLSGDDLLHKMQPTIGETLAQEPGIRSTYFGPNASRPVIRGLEGDQITILQNGVNNLDASAASVDHNVAIDPLSVEKIEVIRGPAALLYGSKAVGGVVNVIDNRIPNKPIAEKLTGATDARFNSANNERSGSMLLEGGLGNYAWHINGFKRLTDNVEIPGFANQDAALQDSRGELKNSQSNSEGVTVGVSKFFKKGYFGASLTNYNSNYGTVAEEDVTIDMDQQRIDFAGQYKEPISHIKEVNYKLGVSDYKHTEFEGSEAGTVFKNRGYDSRVELVHDKIGSLEGAVGFQLGKNDFSALGEEAFLPPTTTQTNSGFVFEEVPLGSLKLQIGGRLDHQKIESEKNNKFVLANSRDDLTGSGSFGFVYDFSKKYSTAISTSYTQRAPNAQELFADGQHVATDTFEVGNQNLNVQKSQGIDLSLRKNEGFFTGEVSLFYNRFQDFITLAATGKEDSESELPIYNYVNLPAEFYGAEIKTQFKAYDKNAHKLNFEIRGDYVEARNRNTSEPLPRISPPRFGGSAIYDYQKIGLRLDTDYTFAANHVPENEEKTDGYFMVNFGADYEINLGPTSSVLYFKTTNLLNEEARNHVSFLKDRAPLAGRSFMVGVKTLF